MQPYSRPTIPRRLGHLGPSTLGSGMIEPVLEKAPDLEMKLDRAAIPSTVPRIVDRAMDREAFLKTPRCCSYLGHSLSMWFIYLRVSDSRCRMMHGQEAVVSAESGCGHS